jgi:hypothetical protein
MTARRPILRSALVVLALLLLGCSSGTKSTPEALPAGIADAAPLLNSVTAAVPKLSQSQAILGVGSILGLARIKMPVDQFSTVSGAIPGADALASEAVAKGLPNTVTGMADVTKFLKKSGISTDQISKLITTVGNEVKAKVDPKTATAFMAAIA